MKKEKYEIPQVELIEIATSDVIMASSGGEVVPMPDVINSDV